MCGRYALGIRATFVRRQLEEHGMPVAEAPDDDDVRQTYNFAPGYHGLVYRADVPDHGAGHRDHEHGETSEGATAGTEEATSLEDTGEKKYKLQVMKWGLVPFWTKRNPDYGSVMKTINARDDSLIENRGMWNTMKQRKRCIVIAQGFYEWLKKNGGKEKVPHYVKRKDSQLMCLAGLWDCVQYEGSEEKLYTYTIITTDSNAQLKFLHDRMPVILENGSDQIRTWLDPKRSEWSKELQSLLKPFDGELECYPVSKDVGKVGNNSPSFIIPISSSENKNNIANFFGTSKQAAKGKEEQREIKEEKIKVNRAEGHREGIPGEDRCTVDEPRTEDNAPMPASRPEVLAQGVKRERDEEEDETEGKGNNDPADESATHVSKRKTAHPTPDASPSKPKQKSGGRKVKSATSNGTGLKSSPAKARNGSQRITNYFNK
ncbi:MAG: hypothetical protein Q9187_007798 [Circinaria calcarea]